jgi:trigger factor
MHAAIEEINSVQRRITVKLSKEQVDQAFGRMFEDLKRKVHLRGFRPGKAPMNLIRKFYGQSSRPDVFEKIIKENLFNAIQNNNLRPVASPVVETSEMPEEGKEYSFSAVVDVMPEIKIDDYRGLSVTVRVPKVDDSAVERELENLRKRRANNKKIEDAAAKAAKGMVAVISHHGVVDGQPHDSLKTEKVSVELGNNELLKDLEEAVLELKVGEEKSVRIEMPADYQDPELAGKTAEMKVKLEELRELVLPNLDDEFAKDLELESLAQLREKLKTSMDEQVAEQRRRQVEHALLDQLVTKNPFEVPPSFVDQITDAMINEMRFENDEARQKALHDNEMRLQFRDVAKRRAQNTMMLGEIGRREKIEVNDEDLNAYFSKFYKDLGQEAPDARIKEMVRTMGNRVRENLFLDKAMQVLIEAAKVSEIPAE